jgi:hypothetical protein
MAEERKRTEEFELRGDQVIAKIKEILHKGNIRSISLRTKEGRTLIEVPLTIGMAGITAATLVAPVWAAIGAIAAMVAELKIVVEREEPAE